ncbi:hypothetical protein D3C86_2220680 [compost metagenome]
MNSQISGFRPVHAQHTQIERVISIHRAEAFQRAGCRHLSDVDKFPQSRNRLRHAYATADIQDGLLRLR